MIHAYVNIYAFNDSSRICIHNIITTMYGCYFRLHKHNNHLVYDKLKLVI